MGWSLGEHDGRDIGYGVPAFCDHPGCGAEIDRGLAYVCGGEPYGGEEGCGLFFCSAHLGYTDSDEINDKLSGGGVCERCGDFLERMHCWEKRGSRGKVPAFKPFNPTPDHPLWIRHKLKDPSWAEWRAENPGLVEELTNKTETTLHLDIRDLTVSESPPLGIGYADPRPKSGWKS